MASSDSVTTWIERFKAGDDAALERLWKRYCSRLTGLARKKLRGVPSRVADECDVANDAFNSLWLGGRAGKFPLLKDRDDLWGLLVIITSRKAADQIARWNRKKRGGGKVRGHSGMFAKGSADQSGSFDDALQAGPGPETLTIWREEYDQLMNRLGDDTLRQVAAYRIAGFQVDEIAGKLGCARTTIFRKLRLIKKILIDPSS
jgi:DNA-directed RNA polymerase specialized sigma24 family protein